MSSNTRPDTLVQDRTLQPPFSLATHGGSIHMGHKQTSLTFDNVRFTPVSSIGQCNTSCSLLAGVSKAKVFRGR
jgi:hypothetical protein